MVKLTLFLYLSVASTANYLYLSFGAQLYIPGQRYSLLDLQYDITSLESKLFNIDITLTFNQVPPYPSQTT